MRLKDKVAIVVGAGQQPGETMGNGRAVALRFAQEGARLLLVDIDRDRAEETAALCRAEGARAEVLAADITVETDCAAIPSACAEAFGRIKVLTTNHIGGRSILSWMPSCNVVYRLRRTLALEVCSNIGGEHLSFRLAVFAALKTEVLNTPLTCLPDMLCNFSQSG